MRFLEVLEGQFMVLLDRIVLVRFRAGQSMVLLDRIVLMRFLAGQSMF